LRSHPLVAILMLTLGVLAGLTAGAPAAPGPGGWERLGTGATPTTPALNGAVYALNADAPGVIYAGGAFTDAGGNPTADYVAKWSGGTWSALGAPALTGAVHAIAYKGGKVYVGGVFANAGGNADADFLAVWDGTKWGPACNGPFGGNVVALQIVGSTLYAGIVNGFTDSYGENETSYYIGGTVATPVTGLRLGTSLDVLDIHNTGGETWSIAGYATYQATEKLSLHLRAEYLRDRGDQKFFVDSDGNSTNPDRVLGLTATAQYDLWKNVISRLELRWDHSLSGQETWGGSTVDSTPTLKNEVMLAANIIYKF